MKALVFHILPSSLYSIKVPFTYQSSLVYPLPPPSTLKGLLANAIQRWENIGPLEALAEVERAVRFIGALPLSPIVVKEHIVSNVIPRNGSKFEAGADTKPTDALSRQYAFTPRLGAVVISQTDRFLERVAEAVACTPLYLGDNESLITCEQTALENAAVHEGTTGERIQTRTYVPVRYIDDYATERDIYWVHTECWRPPSLKPYVFPLTRAGRVFSPAAVEGRLAQPAEIVEGDAFRMVILPPQALEAQQSPRRRRKH